jgi:hypothetical protein
MCSGVSASDAGRGRVVDVLHAAAGEGRNPADPHSAPLRPPRRWRQMSTAIASGSPPAQNAQRALFGVAIADKRGEVLPVHSGGYFACSDVRRHKSTRKPGPDLGDPGCRDQGVKAWSGPTKKPDRPDPAKGNRRPGRSAKLLAPGYRHVGPPAAAPAGGPARCGAGPAHNRVADGPRYRTQSPLAKRAPGDGRPVGAIAVTPGDRRQSAVSSKQRITLPNIRVSPLAGAIAAWSTDQPVRGGAQRCAGAVWYPPRLVGAARSRSRTLRQSAI